MEELNSEWEAAISELHRLLKKQDFSHSEEKDFVWIKSVPPESAMYCVLIALVSYVLAECIQS